MSDVTRILSQIDSGDPTAAEQLLPLVYDELRKLAAVRLAQEKPGQTLQATALVHEAYLRLVGHQEVGDGEQGTEVGIPELSDQKLSPVSCSLPPVLWNSRGHFFAAAAEAMRQILVNNAIRKKRPKHGGDRQRVDLDASAWLSDGPNDEVLALDAALSKLAAVEPLSAEVVKLKYFAGLSIPQVAVALAISPRTADRRWAYARAWLHQELTRG
ncbi:MAG TPA: ECF-type sigma factor [Pirellulaceae bacterium]|nr:ECF-type sigma factor [Pirellulaceae bacterium]